MDRPRTNYYDCKCCVCEKPIQIHIDSEEQCDECLAYEGRSLYEYNVDYSNKSTLDKYQLKMVGVFTNET
jgi:hypothetical protein